MIIKTSLLSKEEILMENEFLKLKIIELTYKLEEKENPTHLKVIHKKFIPDFDCRSELLLAH